MPTSNAKIVAEQEARGCADAAYQEKVGRDMRLVLRRPAAHGRHHAASRLRKWCRKLELPGNGCPEGEVKTDYLQRRICSAR